MPESYLYLELHSFHCERFSVDYCASWLRIALPKALARRPLPSKIWSNHVTVVNIASIWLKALAVVVAVAAKTLPKDSGSHSKSAVKLVQRPRVWSSERASLAGGEVRILGYLRCGPDQGGAYERRAWVGGWLKKPRYISEILMCTRISLISGS